MNSVFNRNAVVEQSPGLPLRLPWVIGFNQPYPNLGLRRFTQILPNVAAKRQRWAMLEPASR